MSDEDNPLKGYEGNMLGALRKTLKYNPDRKKQVLKSWLCTLCGMRITSQDKPSTEGCNNGKHNWVVEE